MVSHKEYLEKQLKSKEMELREVEVQFRVTVAEFNIEKDLLHEQIESIKNQLQEGVE